MENDADIITGELIEIYGDPITKQEHEGWAVVKKVVRRDGLYAYVEVEFEDEPGELFPRTIEIASA